jgi:hypothetical protein
MGAIIRARPALVKFEGQEQAEYKTTVALTQWGEKWNSSRPRIYNVYIELLRRSLAMEQDRLALEADLRRLNSRLSTYIAERLTQVKDLPRSKQRGEVDAMTLLQNVSSAMSAKDQEALNSSGLDSLGLYVTRAP